MKRLSALYVAWILACIGTIWSLYFSEIRHLEPCHLCWYQRILLFPLVLTLGMATYHIFYAIIPYLLPQVFLGLLIALYQVVIQEIPAWDPIEVCGTGPSCIEKIDIGLGFITIPMLSAFNFLLILCFLLYAWLRSNLQEPQPVYVRIK